MKKVFVIAAVVAPLLFATWAFAVPPGKTVVFTPEGTGKVVFSGTLHAEKGAKCNNCHPALFPMKKSDLKMSMKDMAAGKGCGTCHNGSKAFGVTDPADCGKCHK